MPKKKTDVAAAKAVIEKGRRSKWWLRKGTPKRGFQYVDADGKKISSKDKLERINSLVIPPAWKYVRISPSAHSDIQAVGMDTTGRVQYMYSERCVQRNQRKKFAKIEKLGDFLPELRKRTNEDIRLDGLPKEKVLAVMVRLIDNLYFRVGTDKSVREYKTHGITTLLKKHLTIGRKGKLRFEFVGKSHVKHNVVFVDENLADIMKQLTKLGRARKLFQYVDEDDRKHAVKPRELNSYIKQLTSSEFSAKDLRTWGGTLLAAVELAEMENGPNKKERQKDIVKAIKKVSEVLGNTPAVCRGSYIHPRVLAEYERGHTIAEFRPRKTRRVKKLEENFELEEQALVKMLNGG
jgi:DNA topoisomerase-1